MAAADSYVRKYLLRGIPSLFSGAAVGLVVEEIACRTGHLARNCAPCVDNLKEQAANACPASASLCAHMCQL